MSYPHFAAPTTGRGRAGSLLDGAVYCLFRLYSIYLTKAARNITLNPSSVRTSDLLAGPRFAAPATGPGRPDRALDVMCMCICIYIYIYVYICI